MIRSAHSRASSAAKKPWPSREPRRANREATVGDKIKSRKREAAFGNGGRFFIYFDVDGRSKWRLNPHNMKTQMKFAWPIYSVGAIIAIFSFFTAYYLRENDMLATATAAPGVLALFGALYQIFRDNAAFERD